MFVEFSGTEEVLKALADVGRTEDVQFSPDGKRLAIAGFSEGRILVLEVETMGPDNIYFSRATTLMSESLFKEPHGITWADAEVLLVANRAGLVQIVKAPRFSNSPEVMVHSIHALGASAADYISTAGAVTVRPWGQDLFEVLICNTFAHNVSRHYLNREGFSIVASETVLRNGFNVTDGVVFSRSGKWLAVSNHYDHSVFIYRSDDIGNVDRPVGTLRGIGFPHGISFSPDDRAFFVADAGAPYAYIFVAKDGDWSGDRIPASSIKVMDDETFTRGHHNPEEGGPKGLTVTPDGNMICFTHEEEPLVFIDIREELERAGVPTRARLTPDTIDPGMVMRGLMGTLSRGRKQLEESLGREKHLHNHTSAVEARATAADNALAAANVRIRALELHAHGLQEQVSTLKLNAPDPATRRALEQQVFDLQQNAQSLQQKLQRSNRNRQRLRTQVRSAQRRVQALVTSSSWRATAPLRALRRLFARR